MIFLKHTHSMRFESKSFGCPGTTNFFMMWALVASERKQSADETLIYWKALAFTSKKRHTWTVIFRTSSWMKILDPAFQFFTILDVVARWQACSISRLWSRQFIRANSKAWNNSKDFCKICAQMLFLKINGTSIACAVTPTSLES